MEYKYRFAGVEILIQMPEEKKYTDEYRLKNFRVESVENPHIYTFELVEKFAEPDGTCVMNYAGSCVYKQDDCKVRYIGSVEKSLDGAYIRVEKCGMHNKVQLLKAKFPNNIGAKTVLNSIEAERLIIQTGGAVLHCSYVEVDGKAILFTAPSETGKSTQAELWKHYRKAEIINGDRAAIRITENKIMAEGIPFAGSSSYCKNQSFPIKAIVYLSQAVENQIYKLQGYHAFSKVWEGISVNTWDKRDVESVSYTVQEIVKNVPIYHLACTPDKSAVLTLEEALKRGENYGKEK